MAYVPKIKSTYPGWQEAIRDIAAKFNADGRESLDLAGKLDVSGTASFGGTLILSGPNTVASASASGVAGTIYWDASFIYVCVGADSWKRAGISTW